MLRDGLRYTFAAVERLRIDQSPGARTLIGLQGRDDESQARRGAMRERDAHEEAHWRREGLVDDALYACAATEVEAGCGEDDGVVLGGEVIARTKGGTEGKGNCSVGQIEVVLGFEVSVEDAVTGITGVCRQYRASE